MVKRQKLEPEINKFLWPSKLSGPSPKALHSDHCLLHEGEQGSLLNLQQSSAVCVCHVTCLLLKLLS